MAIEVYAPTFLSGMGVPYALEADLDASTLGQANPKAGRADVVEDALGRRPALALKASGEQPLTTTLNVATQRAGHVGRSTFRVRRTVSGVTETNWIGADLPNILIGATFPGWAALANQGAPHAITLDDDSQVSVYWQTNGVVRDIKAQVFNPTTDIFASATTVVSGLDASHNPSPALLKIEDPAGGSEPFLLCAYWVANDTSNEAQVSIRYSRDGGTTWAVWSLNVLPSAITLNSGSPYYTLGRIRLAMVGAQVVLFAHVTSSASVSGEVEHVYHYASADTASSFTYITAFRGYGFPDVVSIGAVAYLVTISAVASPIVYLWPIRAAFVAVTGLTPTDLFGYAEAAIASGAPSAFTYGAVAIAARRDGVLVILNIRCVSNSKTGHATLYDPASATETELNNYGPSAERLWWQDANATSTEYPAEINATAYRGQIRCFSIMVSGTATYDDRLTRLDIGGPSSVTIPPRLISGIDVSPAWAWTSIPTALATAYGWTFTGAGTNSIATNAGWETLTTTANTAYYTRSGAVTATQQLWQLLRVKVDSGGGVSSRVVACGLRAAGVGYGFEFELRFSTTQIRFRNVTGASDQTTITIDTSTTGVDVLMAISGAGVASAWARVIGSDEVRAWTTIEDGYQLTDDAGAGGTTGVVMWGNRASGTATTRWVATGGNAGASLGSADLASGPTNPDDLRGIPFALSGAYATSGVSLGCTGGPAMAGDAWTVRPDAEHPVRYLLPVGDDDSALNVIGGQRTSSTEPASQWWATATTGYVRARFNGAQNRVHPALLAFHVEGLNAASPTVYGYDYDAASYVSLGTIDNTASGLRYSRPSASSPTVRVDTSGTSTTEIYLRAGELRGSYFLFSVGGEMRPIIDNTEGRFSNDGDAALPILTLGGIDGTEATSGSAGKIVFNRATFITAMTPTAEYGAFALRWASAPDLYEAQIRCSIFAVCPVEPLLYARDWGTAYRQEDPSEIYEARSGLRRGRSRMTTPRRILSLPLTTLYDQRPLNSPSTSSQITYKAYSNASYPIAGASGDEFGKLLGAWRRAKGVRHPLVWIPRIATSATTQTLLGSAAGFYCRITSPPQFTDDYGRDTGSVEAPVWRGDIWTLEEEI